MAERVATSVGRGVASGLAGTAVMTAFQKLVEMPITGRRESYAPANFAERVSPIRARRHRRRRVLNYIAHFGIGAGWGAGHALIERTGLRGQRAVAANFVAVYTGDVLVNTGLGLYKPWRWSARDWAIDVGEKLLQAEATGLVYEGLSADGAASDR